MGRSQRHKVYIQGFASNGGLYAQGQYAGMGDAANPPEHMIPAGYRPAVTNLAIDDVDNTNDTSVTVRGTGFYPGSMVLFDGVEAATEFIDDTKVRARVQPKGGGPRTVNVCVRNASLKSNAMPIDIGVSGKPLSPLLTQTNPGQPAALGDVVGACAQPDWEAAPGPFTYAIADDPGGVYQIAGSDIKAKIDITGGDHFLTVTSANAAGTSAPNGATFSFG